MAIIYLINGEKCLVDDEDYVRLSKYRWRLKKSKRSNYAQADINNSTVQMHRVVLDVKESGIVDHINSNGLDNRKANLRVCNRQENSLNRRGDANTTSRYKGVAWHKNRNKWVAYITLDGKTKHLGCFTEEKEAALAYNKEAIKLHGDFARLNIVLEINN